MVLDFIVIRDSELQVVVVLAARHTRARAKCSSANDKKRRRCKSRGERADARRRRRRRLWVGSCRSTDACAQRHRTPVDRRQAAAAVAAATVTTARYTRDARAQTRVRPRNAPPADCDHDDEDARQPTTGDERRCNPGGGRRQPAATRSTRPKSRRAYRLVDSTQRRRRARRPSRACRLH